MQGENISLAKAMEEVTASNILRLYTNDEAKFHKAIQSKTGTNSTKNIEIKINEDYNENVKHSLKNIVYEGYSTMGTKWAIANGLLTVNEQAKFLESIANLSKREFYIPKSKNGQYIIDVGQELVFTNGDFKTATISSIIAFNNWYEERLTKYAEDKLNEYGWEDSLED